MRKIAIVIMLIIATAFSVFAQVDRDKVLTEKSPEGTEFWLCFMRNHNNATRDNPNVTPLDLKLFLTSDKDANVKIRIKSIGFREDIFVKGGTVKAIQVSNLAQV